MQPTHQSSPTPTDLGRHPVEASSQDPDMRHLLAQAFYTIAERLSHRDTQSIAGSDDDPEQQLRAAARRFEVQHPALATALESLVDALARMGI